MKHRDDIKKIVSEDGIHPNFMVVTSYYKHFGEKEFYSNYAKIKDKGVFKKAERIIKEYKLQSYKSDLIYFLVRNAKAMEQELWAKNENLHKLKADRVKQEKLLSDFIPKLNRVNFDSKYTWRETRTFPELKEIKFITNKNGHDLKIDSFYLCEELLDLIESWLIKKSGNSSGFTKKPNASPRQYDKNFVLGLKPFIDYLDKETIKWTSKNKIYECVSEFLDVLNINITSVRIKDTLKAKPH